MKVIDSFIFFNELDVLEIRLNELYDTVDYFILHESPLTHTGLPKPLYFEENKGRFRKFENKIIYKLIDDTPNDFTSLQSITPKDYLHKNVLDKLIRHDYYPKDHLPYNRDAFEKESLIRSMDFCEDDDIIIFGDADEIPNPEAIKYVLNNYDKENIYNFEENHYWFYLNCMREDLWLGNTLLSFKNFKEKSFCDLRKFREGVIVKDAGWHFSFCSGVKQKVESYGEQSINRKDVTDDTELFVEDCIKNNHDFYYRPCKFNIVDIDHNMPKYLVNNKNRFVDKGMIKLV